MATKNNKCARGFDHIWVKIDYWTTATHNVFFCPICKGKRWVGRP